MEWISVKDRLPEIKNHHVSDGVIVYFEDGGYGFSELVENCFGQTWFDCERSPSGDTEFRVTHWMPLPAPPED